MNKKRLIAAVLCIILFAGCIPSLDLYAKSASVGKVGGLKAGVTSVNSVNIKWSPQEGASGYEIYRCASRDGRYSLIRNISAGGQAFCNLGLRPGKEYYYKVRAYVKRGKKTSYGKYSKPLRTNTKNLSSKTARAKANLNVRKYAGINYARVAGITAGTKVKILCEAEDTGGILWYRIQFKLQGKKQKGYVRGDLIR